MINDAQGMILLTFLNFLSLLGFWSGLAFLSAVFAILILRRSNLGHGYINRYDIFDRISYNIKVLISWFLQQYRDGDNEGRKS